MIIKDNQTILIPIDFSKESYFSVKQTYNLAKFTKSKLMLLHVADKGGTERSDELVKLANATREETGLEVGTKVVTGELYESINKVAAEVDASLTVIALAKDAKFKSGLFGGGMTVPKFLIASPCPVITMRSTDLRDGCQNIVMPFDLTPESREKVSYAVQLARLYKSDIRIVSIFKPNDEEYENKLFPYLQQVKKFIKNEGVHCTNRSLPSTTPAEAIIDYAVKHECDLIIQINTRDLTLSERMNGTVGHKVVELSNVPVLNVNPMKRESMSHFSSGM